MQCKFTTKFLDKNGIAYEERSVAEEENLEFIKNLGYAQVPVVYVREDEHWAGFSDRKLDTLVS